MCEKPIRILYVNGGIMDRGGISSVMMNYYMNFESSILHIDFLVHGYLKGDRDQEIIDRGGTIYRVPPKSKQLLKNYFEVRKIIQEGKYDIVHSHADTGNAYILKIAKLCGVKIRISHSHNTGLTINNSFRQLLNDIQKKSISKYATHKFACSKVAGKWLYGEKSEFEVIPNAIDLNKFMFNVCKRESLRKQYGLEGKFVIGHIGRFDYQKNQMYLLDIIKEKCKQKKEARLVLIGDGKDRIQIEKRIKELEIQSEVILLGQKENIGDFLNIFDIFVFPSRFEGLGMAVVEAQVNGLSCICSDAVPRETNLTGNVEYLPLETLEWMKALDRKYARDSLCLEKVMKKGYEISRQAKVLQKKYLEMVK